MLDSFVAKLFAAGIFIGVVVFGKTIISWVRSLDE